MKSLPRPVLIVIFIAGIVMFFWPVGEAAYGLWRQHALRAAWEAEVGHRPANNTANHVAVAQDDGADDQNGVTAPARFVNPGASSQKTHKLKVGASPNVAKPHPKKVSPDTTSLEKSAKRRPRRWLPTRLIIRDIDVDAIVVQGLGEKALREGPGHDPASALPGEPGNCVIAAHRNVYGWWFYRLGQLGGGSLIELRTPTQTFTYRVAVNEIVHEEDTSLLRAPRQKNASPRLTLYTCTLPKSDNRVVVVANLVSNHTS